MMSFLLSPEQHSGPVLGTSAASYPALFMPGGFRSQSVSYSVIRRGMQSGLRDPVVDTSEVRMTGQPGYRSKG